MSIDFFTDPKQKRKVLTPIVHNNLWNIYKKQQAVIWTMEEIDWTNDKQNFESLDDQEQEFLLNIVAFFASSDMIIVDNLFDHFMSQVTVAECKSFYTLQAFIETVHSETYSKILEVLIHDEEKRRVLANAVHFKKPIKNKADWAEKYMNPEIPFKQRLWAFCIFEGVLFSASFCAIYWLRKKNKCHGITYSNELIARDEGLHALFAIEMYNMYDNPADEEIIHTILKDAVALEEEFVRYSFNGKRFIGMNADSMIQYVQYCADHILSLLKGPSGNYSPIWNVENPFPWMDMISIDSKTNFFEKRTAEYQLPSVGLPQNSKDFTLSEDF